VKLRHAAALALMGWYLIVPPPSCKRGWVSEWKPLPCNAPLSEWIVTLKFSSREKCTAELGADIAYGKQEATTFKGSSSKQLVDSTEGLYWRALTERCISTDDPRLAK
jgi:hypothetical protein